MAAAVSGVFIFNNGVPQETPMQHKDEALKRIEAALEHEAHIDLKSALLTLEFHEGTLLLEGEVPNVSTKKQALRAVSHVGQVAGIVDHLRVATNLRPGDGATRDAVCKWIMSDVDFQNCAVYVHTKGRREMLREAGHDPCGAIEVAVNDGVVSLSGHVISLSHKRLAGVLSWWARGCRDVENELEVVPPEEDNDHEIADGLRLVLECDPYVHADQIAIDCRNGEVILGGEVSSEDERQRAEMDAWCLYAVDRVTNHIRVR